MAGLTTPSTLTLLCLFGWGIFATFIFSSRNGLFDLLENIANTRTLPVAEPLSIPEYTGIKLLDNQMAALTGFFWVVTDGQNPALSLHSIEFLGQGMACWVLCVIEGTRAGNKGRLVSFVATMGLIVQNISFAVGMPVYLALHLLTSATVSSSNPQSILSRTSFLNSVPFSITVGGIAPAILMSLSAPSVISYKQKELFCAIFQPFPALVYIAGFVVETLFSSSARDDFSNRAMVSRYKTALYQAYMFGLACSALCHIFAWTLSLTAVTLPDVFTPEFASAFHPLSVFQNTSPFSDAKISSLAEGVTWFLQWDLLNGSIAVLVWAITVHVNAYVSLRKEFKLVSALWKAAVATVIVGPCGAAILLIWERDEIMLESLALSEKKGI